MLVLSRELRKPVRRADGSPVGRLRDLTVRLGAEDLAVHRLMVGHKPEYLIPWASVANLDRRAIWLRDGASIKAHAVLGRRLPLEDDELLLVRDVLDTQIVDVVGHRLARVSDVLLTTIPDGRVQVVAVDISTAAVLGRLGVAWLGRRLPERAIAWADLHLTSARGHQIQLATTSAAVHQLDERGLAELLTRLSVTHGTQVIRTLGTDRSAPAVARTHPSVRQRLVLALERGEAERLIDQLPSPAADHARNAVTARTPLTGRRFSRLRGWQHDRPPGADNPGHEPPGAVR